MKDFYFRKIENIFLFPVVHYSYEFALAARQVIEELQPAAIGVELPASLQELLMQGIGRLPKISILAFGSDRRNYIRIEPVDAFIEAARICLEKGIPLAFLDLALEDYPQLYQPVPDPYAMKHLGHRKYCEALMESFSISLSPQQDRIREMAMAFHAQELQRKMGVSKPILFLCGMAHLQGLEQYLAVKQPRPFEKRPPARLYHLSSSSLGEIMGTFPFFTAVYERQRSGMEATPEDLPVIRNVDSVQVLRGKKEETLEQFFDRAVLSINDNDRANILSLYVLRCREYYEKQVAEEVLPGQVLLLEQFSKKYARIKGMILPDFYELLIAGRSCVSSHFCYRMWELGTCYPPQAGPSELEIIELRAEDIFALVNKVRMNPLPPLKPRAPYPRFLKRKEKRMKAARENLPFHPFSICSYQPEDIRIENYGNYLRSKGKNILSEERKRVRPFETSLLDGIDLRETIRNWHTGNIYVQECQTVKGEVGSVVVIFDEEMQKYPYTMTWLGEHHQESDMAFYATDPDEHPVGPGIRKAIYGGFLMTMPPGRLLDVFGDPAYSFAANHAERLLLAAIDYSLDKYVVYAAPNPPRPIFQVIAGRYGRRILYIPLAQLSPVMLQKIRSFHILASRSVREYADDYIW